MYYFLTRAKTYIFTYLYWLVKKYSLFIPKCVLYPNDAVCEILFNLFVHIMVFLLFQGIYQDLIHFCDIFRILKNRRNEYHTTILNLIKILILFDLYIYLKWVIQFINKIGKVRLFILIANHNR